MKHLYLILKERIVSLAARSEKIPRIHKICFLCILIVSISLSFCENIMEDMRIYNEIMEISSVSPVNNATGVLIGTDISASFTSDIDMSTVNSSTFSVNGGAVTGAFSYDPSSMRVIFTPASELLHNTLYTIDINQGLLNRDGKFISAPYSWSFTTEIYYFNILSVFPGDLEINVPVNTTIEAGFDDNIDSATLTSNFLVNGGAVTGIITYDAAARTAIFTPTGSLSNSTVYNITLTTGIKNLTGESMAANYTWSFTTAAAPLPEIYVISPVSEIFLGDTYDFGSTTSPQNFSIGNSGNGPLTVSAVTVTGPDAGEFNLVVNSGLPLTVNPGVLTANVFTLTFNPGAAGNKTAVVTISNDDGDESSFAINLIAVSLSTPAPEIQVVHDAVILVTPTSTVDFGTLVIGDTGTETIVMQNLGTANLDITDVSLGGSDPGYFSTDFGAVPATIVPGGSKTFNLYFSAPVKTNSRATITFQNNDADEGTFVVKLKGRTMP